MKKLFMFDMGGVVTTNAELSLQIASFLGVEVSEYKAKSKPLIAQYSDGKISRENFWNKMSEAFQKEISVDLFHLFFHPKLNCGTVELVRELKDKGCRVICATNTNESFYLNHLERGDYTYFDQTYCSHFMGVSKPDVNFWKLILQIENEDFSNAVFFDDRIENCEAAKSLGITAIHFESIEQVRRELTEKGLL